MTAWETALKGLEGLPSNWDGHGALPIDARCIAQVRAFCQDLVREDIAPPTIVPSSLGGLQIEWHQGDMDQEIEVRPTGDILVLIDDNQKGTSVEGTWDTMQYAVTFVLGLIARRVAKKRRTR